MADEHGFQSPEGHRLCANNCGVFASSATQSYCSKCYHEISLKEAKKSPAKSQPEMVPEKAGILPVLNFPSVVTAASAVVTAAKVAAPTQNRCALCRRRVGLVGFKCRCGPTFCGAHRYPEEHLCKFDYKSMGRETIAKENPLVKAEKLKRI